jgi:hypothetical protein
MIEDFFATYFAGQGDLFRKQRDRMTVIYQWLMPHGRTYFAFFAVHAHTPTLLVKALMKSVWEQEVRNKRNKLPEPAQIVDVTDVLRVPRREKSRGSVRNKSLSTGPRREDYCR